MKIYLKYTLPIFIILTGTVLIAIQIYFETRFTKQNMLDDASMQARVLGNRLADQLSKEWKDKKIDKYNIRSTIATYMVNDLDQVTIYNREKDVLFSQYISSHKNEMLENLEDKIHTKLIKEQFAHLEYIEKNNHIVGYFPIALPIAAEEIHSKSTGVILLVFDITSRIEALEYDLIHELVSNLIVLILMGIFFSGLLYLLVFKRLTSLHNATKELSKGNLDVNVQTSINDELSDVINTFNNMAKQMTIYRDTMEDKVAIALQDYHEQNKIMLQQGKLASMGEMIGNIAHQWRQPLNALGIINQKIEMLSKNGKLTPELVSKNVESAAVLITNMSNTIDDFRDFFKPDKELELFDLQDVVSSVLKILSSSFEHDNISVSVNIDKKPCEVYGYKNEFSQVLVNLINNAKDALIDNVQGSRNIFIKASHSAGKVILSIEDNAGGIAENVMERIFEPYYTTKEEGKGTGIGLYMSKVIIENNMKGRLEVSNANEGAKFTIIFDEKLRK